MSRPLGLLTRPDVAFIASALNAAVASANEIEEVFGPRLVYNRPELDALMLNDPMTNAAEWLDEQAGVLLKVGLPLLSIGRIEDGVSSVMARWARAVGSWAGVCSRRPDRPGGQHDDG